MNENSYQYEIELRGISKSFGSTKVLENVDLDVSEHQVLALIGPSGSGKSTLLRCLNLLEKPDSGTIKWKSETVAYKKMSNRQLARHRQRMGMVFQHFNLFPHKTAIQNIMEGLRSVAQVKKADAYEKAMILLRDVGLEEKADAWPSQLSGGQKQRVAIARALAMNPQVLLLDEVTSALDVEVISEINDLLLSIAKQGMTMVVVTHDLSFAKSVSHRIHFLDEGRIVESGTPSELLTNPREQRTQEFVARYARS